MYFLVGNLMKYLQYNISGRVLVVTGEGALGKKTTISRQFLILFLYRRYFHIQFQILMFTLYVLLHLPMSSSAKVFSY